MYTDGPEHSTAYTHTVMLQDKMLCIDMPSARAQHIQHAHTRARPYIRQPLRTIVTQIADFVQVHVALIGVVGVGAVVMKPPWAPPGGCGCVPSAAYAVVIGIDLVLRAPHGVNAGTRWRVRARVTRIDDAVTVCIRQTGIGGGVARVGGRGRRV